MIARRPLTRPARTAAAPERNAMRGPRRAAVAIAVFFAASLAVVHLSTRPVGPPPALPAVDEVEATSPAPPPPAMRAAQRPPESGPAEVAAADLGVVDVPSPASAGSAPREGDVSACVEQALKKTGGTPTRETAPGRWPGVKRAREELRRRRLALRAECERSLAL